MQVPNSILSSASCILLVPYSLLYPDLTEYAEFEKYYSRQLKAVGHKMSSKTAKQLERTTDAIQKEEINSRSTDKRQPAQRRSRRKSSVPSTEPLTEPPTSPDTPVTPAFDSSELFLRCQVDYDPSKESHQPVPKKAFVLRSGDLICVVNWTDPEWWEVSSCGIHYLLSVVCTVTIILSSLSKVILFFMGSDIIARLDSRL